MDDEDFNFVGRITERHLLDTHAWLVVRDPEGNDTDVVLTQMDTANYYDAVANALVGDTVAVTGQIEGAASDDYLHIRASRVMHIPETQSATLQERQDCQSN